MANTWKILDPVADVMKITTPLPKIGDVRGKVVGFVSNEAWVCLPTIWKTLDETLRKKYGVAQTFKVIVPAAYQGPNETIDNVAAKSAAAIAGLSN